MTVNKVQDAKSRVKIRKYMGDDMYSWAVFVNGRAICTGMSKREATFLQKKEIERMLAR